MLRSILTRVERQIWSRRTHKWVARDYTGLRDTEELRDVLRTMRGARDVRPIEMPPPAGQRLVIIAPHPDDEAIGPGGTLIGALAAGSSAHVVYLTSGSRDEATATIRETEARACASSVGYTTEFLRMDLTGPPAALTAELAEAISRAQPDKVFVSFFADDHPEHQLASKLVVDALDGGLLSPKLEIWAYQVYTNVLANVVVETTEHQPAKHAAIQHFASQLEGRDWAHFAAGLSAYNSRFVGGNHPAHAEMFHVASLGDYADLCRPYVATLTPGASGS